MSRSGVLRWWPSLVALVLAVGVVVLAVRAGAGDTPRAAPGDVVDPYFAQDEPATDPVTVRVPWAELRLWVDGPRDRLPDDFGQAEGLLPPEGGGFVRVDVGLSDRRLLATASTSLTQPATVLTLVVGGERVPLTGVPGGFELGTRGSVAPLTRYVAVDETDADELGLEVEYDGVTQEVDLRTGEVDAGGLERLADVPYADSVGDGAAGRTPCGRPRLSPGYRADPATVQPCEVEHSGVLPYVHGLGLAPEGRGYVALDVLVDEFAAVRDVRSGERLYGALRVLRMEVDGAPVEGPAWLRQPSESGADPTGGSGVAVVDDATTVPVRVVLAPVGDGGDGPGRPVRFTYDLELEVAS